MATAVPYKPVSTPEWAASVRRKFDRTVVDDDIVLTGSCPHCHDDMYAVVRVGPREVEDGGARAEAVDGARPRWKREMAGPLVVACNCTASHEGRPEGELGCGAYGSLTIEYEIRDQEP